VRGRVAGIVFRKDKALSALTFQQEVVRAFQNRLGRSAVIYPAAFLVAASLTMMLLGLNFYVQDVFGAGGAEVGALFALYFGVYIGGCLLIRPLTDGIAPRYLIIAATALMGTLDLSLLLARSLTVVFILFAVFGTSISLFWPPLMGWLSAGSEGKQLNRKTSRFNISWSTGAIIGPIVGGWLSDKDTAAPLWASGALLLFTSAMVIGAVLTLPRLREEVVSGGENADGSPAEDRSTRFRFPAWVGAFTTFTALSVLLNIFPVFGREELHLSKSAIGGIVFCRSLFMSVGFVLLGRHSFWNFRAGPMLLGQLLLAGCVAMLIGARGAIAIGALFCASGFFMAAAYASSLFHGAAGSIRRTQRGAIHESLLATGQVSGSFVGGIIYATFSISWTYRFCLAVLLAGLVAQSILCIWASRVRRSEAG
jgi:MFS family permease